MSETITADHLNATHLGKRITINGRHGTVVSGKLKKISADYAMMPSFTSYSFCKEDIPEPLIEVIKVPPPLRTVAANSFQAASLRLWAAR